MLAEEDALYVLHRRNLTRVADTDGDGVADRFDRVAALPHGVADTYDYAYGLVRDRAGGFVLSYAPYANTTMPGSGGVLRLVPGQGAAGGRLRAPQPAGLVRRAGSRGLLHRQPGRMGRDQQALPRARRDGSTASRTRRRQQHADRPAGTAGGLGPVRLGQVDQRRRLRHTPAASSAPSPASSSWPS